jgi:NADH dehydrogenase
LILLDKQVYHFKKVILVEAPTRSGDSLVLFHSYQWNNVELLQGVLTDILPIQYTIQYKTLEDHYETLHFDQLVIAVGSVIKNQMVIMEDSFYEMKLM